MVSFQPTRKTISARTMTQITLTMVRSKKARIWAFSTRDRDAPFFSLKLRYEGDRLAAAALNGKPLAL